MGMNKSGALGMRCHQAVSFSRPLLRLSRRKAVFWPGCALMQMDPAILLKTAEILRRTEPELGLSACCCGQPTRYLAAGAYPARQKKLASLLARHGVRRVYTACPNCFVQLEPLGGVEVRPIWAALAACIRRQDIIGGVPAVTVHDPCPMRRQLEELAAVRTLLDMAGAKPVEPAHSREAALCCGNAQMLHTRDPEKSAQLRTRRIAEFASDLPVASCCAGCLDAFRSEGLDTVHLLEVLFGRSGTRCWGNRLAFSAAVGKQAAHG